MREFRMHSGARTALYVAGGLTCLLIIGIPIGIWIILRASRAKVTIDQNGLVQHGLTTVRMPYAEVQRIGVLEMPIVARGIGGSLARKKCGGDVGVNLCIIDSRGKTRKFVASMYEDYASFMDEFSRTRGLPVETVAVGVFGFKWPPANTAA